MSRPIIRQSTISKQLYDMFFPKKDDSELSEEEIQERKDWRKRIMKMGKDEHFSLQQWLSVNYGGEEEFEVTIENFDLIVRGHVDYVLGDVGIEMKFSTKEEFAMWDSYIFQIGVYMLGLQKPILHVTSLVDSGEMLVQYFDLVDIDRLSLIIDELFQLYIFKLIIDNKSMDERYDTDQDYETLKDRIRELTKRLRKLLYNNKKTFHKFRDVLVKYCMVRGWAYYE